MQNIEILLHLKIRILACKVNTQMSSKIGITRRKYPQVIQLMFANHFQTTKIEQSRQLFNLNANSWAHYFIIHIEKK